MTFTNLNSNKILAIIILLKQSYDSLHNEYINFSYFHRQQLSQSKLKLIEYETDKQAKDEERQELLAATELQGWLYKRGVRGMTGKKWRRRFFHMGQGFKLYYYKTSSMQLPQGYIDLEKVTLIFNPPVSYKLFVFIRIFYYSNFYRFQGNSDLKMVCDLQLYF